MSPTTPKARSHAARILIAAAAAVIAAVAIAAPAQATMPVAPQCHGNESGPETGVRAGSTRQLYLSCFDDQNRPLTASIDRTRLRGTLVETGGGNPLSPATWTYTAPATVGDGADTFQFSATDDQGATSAPATMNIVVHDELYTTAPQCFGNESGPETGVRAGGTRQLYLSCFDDEGDPMTVSVDQTGLRGTLTPSNVGFPPIPNMWTYTAPATAGNGADAFQFSATDDHGAIRRRRR